jgi:hypothetical protein
MMSSFPVSLRVCQVRPRLNRGKYTPTATDFQKSLSAWFQFRRIEGFVGQAFQPAIATEGRLEEAV